MQLIIKIFLTINTFLIAKKLLNDTSLSMDHKLDHPYNTENVNSVLFLGGWMKN